MTSIAIGDIHGNLAPLDDLLDKLLPRLGPRDTLVFLGDYIDNGANSRECVERILELRDTVACRVVALRGNHEDWMLRSREDPTRHSWLIAMDAFATIRSYSPQAAEEIWREMERLGPRLLERAPLPYELFFDALPPAHLAFFASLPALYRSDSVIFAHAGVDPEGGPPEEQESEILLWGVPGFPENYRDPDGVAYGHWSNVRIDEHGWPHPLVLPNKTYGLDTIAHGVLTAVEFPGGLILQSKKYD